MALPQVLEEPKAGKQLQGRGAFKGKLGGTEAYLREKQAELEREEGSC